MGRRNRWPLPQRLVRRFELPDAAADSLNGLFVDRLGRKLWFRDERSGLNTVDLDRMMIVSADANLIAWGSLPARGDVAFVQGRAAGFLELRTNAATRALIRGDVRVDRGYVVAATSGEEPSFVALGADSGEWLIYSRPWMAPKFVVLSAGTPVYGAALVEGRSCLLVRSSAHERLRFIDSAGVVASVIFPGEVEHACLHPNGQWIAAQVAGGLYVVDRRRGIEAALEWTVTPRLPRGTVAAAALVFDERTLAPAEVRRRVLAWWSPGAQVRRTEIGLVLVLATPRRIAVNAATGLPLIALGAVFVGCELALPELRALEVPAGGLVVARGGRAIVVGPGQDVAPADWIALGPVAIVETRALSEPRATPLAPPVTIRPLHEVLGPAIPPPAEERAAFLRDAAASAGRTSVAASVAGVFNWLRSWLNFRARARSGGGAGQSPEPSPLAQRLRAFFARLQRFIGLQRLLGRRHARYLADMIEMLSGGDVREGLRHAIPLQSMKEILERARPRGMSWRLPTARSQLEISPMRVRATSSLMLDGGLFEQLRALYRSTFERLDAQHRHEEAAFVLAELMQSDEEAVAYLERNGEHRRAAELAEARGCAPGLIVRAWFLAGDRERAVRIARERGAFHDAVARLERSHASEARQLRLLWADALAASGSYADAVAIGHALSEAQSLVPRWLELGLAAGEAQAPRLLAFQAALLPEKWAETRAVAEAWMTAEDAGATARRRALVEALPLAPSNAGSARLARLCARWVLARGDEDVPAIAPDAMQSLLKTAHDAALDADLPTTRRRGRQRWLEGDGQVGESIEPRGPLSVRDAAVLSSGRLLVAQGEAGVVLLSRSGTPLHRFDCPADSLVISDAGDRAIALADRGGSTQLGQLDLAGRQHRAWGLVSIAGGARTYDGSVWFAHAGNRLMGLDAMAAAPRCFWAVDIDEGAVLDVVRSPREAAVLAGGFGIKSWRYELPGLTLRERKSIKPALMDSEAPPVVTLAAWATLGETAYAVDHELGSKEIRIVALGSPPNEVRVALPALRDLAIRGAATHELLAFSMAFESGAHVWLFDRGLRPRAQFQFPQSKLPFLRFCGSDLVMSADGGRLAIFDTDRGALRIVGPLG